jgi:hypothetical protein
LHILKWTEQEIVSEYLDFLISENFNLNYENYSYIGKNKFFFWKILNNNKTLYYNEYLKKKNLNNSLFNKLHFVINDDIKI